MVIKHQDSRTQRRRKKFVVWPVCNPTYFEGNILAIKDRPYGFFEVEITTLDNLQYPVLQTRVQTADGVRTAAPLGTWTDVLSSSEIYNAMDNFGYKFNVLRGYTFNKGYLFKYICTIEFITTDNFETITISQGVFYFSREYPAFPFSKTCYSSDTVSCLNFSLKDRMF